MSKLNYQEVVGCCRTIDRWYSVTPTRAKVVYLTGIVAVLQSAEEWGELRVYFAESSWTVSNDGYIYGDPRFIVDFKSILITGGFSERAVGGVYYSESGMQGKDYVSFDINTDFISELDEFMNFVNNTQKTVQITTTYLVDRAE